MFWSIPRLWDSMLLPKALHESQQVVWDLSEFRRVSRRAFRVQGVRVSRCRSGRDGAWLRSRTTKAKLIII